MKIVIGSVLVVACFGFACSYKPNVRSNEGSLESKSESVEEALPSEQVIDFEGVSFTYDPRVFGDVKKEVVPERKLEDPTHKPDYVAPKCIQFEFEFGRKDSSNARIAVYPLDRFDDAYAISPEMVKYINDHIAGLRKALINSSFRLDHEIPHLEYRDAFDVLYAKVRDFDFPSGNGIIFVTYWGIEPELISNRNLIYRFEGITADGKFYVTAETPVSVAFLPDGYTEEFEGYTYDNLYKGNSNSTDSEARIEKYRNSISKRLEKLNSTDYSPHLEKFEAIISSLKINK